MARKNKAVFLVRLLKRATLTVLVAAVAIVVANFPYHTDRLLSPAEIEKNRQYYASAYAAPERAHSEADTKYTKMGRAAAEAEDIVGQVSRFVERHDLRRGAMLDIGSGSGYLQDIVENYTGLDISPNAARFYRKKFVQGSATAMPFADNSFDGGWSIWVFEHVPNPEQGLLEIRRVMKPGAAVLFYPAWNCTPWAADGYGVRPYSDFGAGGRLIKASIPALESAPYRAVTTIPARIARSTAAKLGPTRLHYHTLTANEKEYWEPDSDAINSIDRHETMLWFTSRGDECLNCEGRAGSILMSRTQGPLIIRIRK